MSAQESTASTPHQLTVDVWSDISCPYCYMGYVALDRAIEKFSHGESVVVHTRSFLLMPRLTDTPTMTPADVVAAETGSSVAEAAKSNAALVARGAELGLTLDFDRVQVVDTRAAHEFTHLAAEQGLQHAMVMRLFRAYFTEGVNVAEHQELIRLGSEIGLEEADVAASLTAHTFAHVVENDIAEAKNQGITGTPFFLFAGEFGVSGAQGIGGFMNALSSSWASLAR